MGSNPAAPIHFRNRVRQLDRFLALLNLRINMSGVGILPAWESIVTGKMPIPQQDAHSTARCSFHSKMLIPQQDARSTKMPVPQVRPVANLIINGSRAPKRCPFYKTFKIIPLFSNAVFSTTDSSNYQPIYLLAILSPLQRKSTY
ncbi:hypothetical protein BJP36_39735 [Moorena producens JHB]|uniref:Uncharacterized protein n=1 Tax=Moorena producens (strain JHB) TaxID=1454205 RepID=A0A9Q9SV56_MOOP1|nr:hypothetical protein [Moorena producens]WAN70187.1 hypothetical protein BJP36_39735 [Moorena producens JHB]